MNALGSLLLGGEMEPVGEEEGQLVFLSHKSFVSLFYTESSLGNELAGQEGLLGEMTYLGFPHCQARE
jgi:hypothetical protein